MFRRSFSLVIIALLLVSAIVLAFNVKPAQAAAQTVYINSDGSVSPAGAPISSPDNITYTLTGNVSLPAYYGIVVGRSNILINGNGYTIQGNGTGNGVNANSISNLTITNTNINNFQYGIYLGSSSSCTVSGNNATSNYEGIYLSSSVNITVSGNTATANSDSGIILVLSVNSTVSGNNATSNGQGIYLASSSNCTVSGNTATSNSNYGIGLASSGNSTVSGNNATSNYDGIYLASSSSCTVSGNTATSNRFGIYLASSSSCTVSGNTATSNSNMGIYLSSSVNITVSGNNATSNGQGIYLDYSSNCTVSGNNATSNSHDGIELYYSGNSIVSGNIVASNSYYGILLASSGNSTVSGNTATSNVDSGIYLSSSVNITVSGNTATSTMWGIFLASSSSCTVSGNTAASNAYGIYLESSGNNTVSGNTATSNSYGIYLFETGNSIVSGNIVASNSYYGIILDSEGGPCNYNTVSGNNATSNSCGIYLGYAENNIVSGNIVASNSWGILLDSSLIDYGFSICNYNTVSGNNATSNSYGIYLGYAENNIVSGNIVASNSWGILLASSLIDYGYPSNYNTVSGNIVASNSYYGIELNYTGNNNIVSGNIVASNSYGIYLNSSNTNTVIGNNVTSNSIDGIVLDNSSSNTMYHNNFVGNVVHAYIDSSSLGNAWNFTYPIGGNYWDNYTGVDVKSGPNQNLPGSDGIGDTPYAIDASNTDHYPLMNLNSTYACNLTVFSAHDSPIPGVGVHTYDSGTSVTCNVTSPVVEGGVSYTCTGWSGTGSVPSSGSSTSVSFTISQNSTITWNWAVTPCTLTVSSAHGSAFSVGVGVHFYSNGSRVTCLVVSPVTEGGFAYACTGWTGTGSVPTSGSGTYVAFTITRDSSISWNWIPVQCSLTVFSAHGSPSPSVGVHVYSDGSLVTCSVASPVVEGGVSYTCTGWSGTGSVPMSGTLTSVTCYFTQNSTILWKWTTQWTLTVSSAHGSPSPSVGVHVYSDGSLVTCSVASPVVEGGVSYTCTGWSGTGSVPSSGSSTSVSFTISQNSTITWNWATQWTLTVSSAHGSPSPSVGVHVYSDGSLVTCSVASPVTEGGFAYACTGWTGTGSVPTSGSGTSVTFTITLNSSISWNWILLGSAQCNLTVSSAHDSPSPSVGVHTYTSGTSVTCSVTSPVVEGGVSYTCTGWSGTGSVPSGGSVTSVTFTITQNSTITWNWAVTQWKLTVSSAHDSPSPGVGDHLYSDGSSVTCSVTSPVTEGGVTYVCIGWSGTGSVPSSGTGTSTGSFTIAQDSSITWNWQGTSVQWKLTVSSAHDSPSPGVGDHLYSDGSSVTCSVASSVFEGSYIWTCTGWNGAGSVPSYGNGTSVTFTITQNSTITWYWCVNQWKLTVSSAHDSPNPGIGDRYYNGGTSLTCSVTSPVTEGGVTYVCIGWSGTGSVPSSGTGTSTGSFTIAQDSSITWNWQIVQWKLTVSSAHDSPNPGIGDHFYGDGSSVTCSVTSPVVEGGVSYTCTGWSGTGSVPSGGSVTSVTFTITQNSTITWNWAVTQWKLTVSSAHDSPNPGIGDHYYGDGSSVTCSVTSPVTEGSIVWTCTGWTGAGSVPSTGTGKTVTFIISQNSTITWNWQGTPVQWKLTVSSAHDSPSPPNGDSFYNDGSSVTCSVTSPVTEGGVMYVCAGWSGTGSVPSGGSVTSVTFTITQNSTVTWNWAVTALVHDVAVTNVTSSQTIVGQGLDANLTVTLQNQGDYTETFNVTAYANVTAIQTETLTLTSQNSTNLTFTWNTTALAYGNYTLSAYAWPVPGETDIADNNFTGGWVYVSIIGDITGGTPSLLDFVPDGKVDMKDVGVVARYFNENVPPAPANCDLTGPTAGVPDGIIDMRDIGLVARYFGTSYTYP